MFAKLLSIISAFFDLLLAPFAGMSPYVGLTVLSAVTGIVMVFLYQWTTNQEKLKEVKKKIKILFLEVRLYKDDMAEMFSIQKEIMKENFRYLRYTLKSAIVLIIPILFILMDLNARYSYAPIHPGQSFVVSAIVEETSSLDKITLDFPGDLTLEVPPIRIPAEKRVSWQLRAGSSGNFPLAFHQGKSRATQRVFVSRRIERIQPEIDKGHSFTSRLFPDADFLPFDSPVRSVRIDYPEQAGFFGLQPGWLYYFFLVSMIAGLLIKRFLGLA